MARGYSAIWLFSILSFIAINAYLKTENSKYLTLFILFSALAIWTIPVAFLPFLVIILYLADQQNIIISLKVAVATFFSSAILYLPILLIYGLGLSSQISTGEEESYARLIDYHINHSMMDFYYNFIMIKPLYFGFTVVLFVFMIIQNSKYKKLILLVSLSMLLIIILQKSIPPARVFTILLLFIYIPLSDSIGTSYQAKKYSYIIFLPLIALIAQVAMNQKQAFMMTNFRYESAETVVSGISEPTSIICAYPMEAPLKFYWINYLRDEKDFNVVSENLMVVVSLKHGQTLNQLCKQYNINSNTLLLTFKNEDIEVYREVETNLINFEF
jgi:hypothetical protein